MKFGRVTVSDRASRGIYADASGPEIERILRSAFAGVRFEVAVVPDEVGLIVAALRHFADDLRLDLVVTTGGTGITDRDVTPEATRQVLDKELPGFAEAMRMLSMARVKTAILSRAIAGIRGHSLIVNLPGSPAAVRECLEILTPAIREALEHLQGREPHSPR